MVGESFNPGDVLLEIETDKAQMDVEAQDSGILAKILVPQGTQNVGVGRIIAVLAEEGDDLSSVDIPTEGVESQESGKASALDEESPQKTETSTENQLAGHILRQEFVEIYPPAVLRLLQEYGIEDPKAIHATGPHGRLLKGDVLAHVGSIKKEVPETLRNLLVKKQKLDLTNVVIKKEPSPKAVTSPTQAEKEVLPSLAQREAVVTLGEALKLQKNLSGSS